MSTLEDSQGERRDKQFLADVVSSMPQRFPLGRHHDASLPYCGYLENFSLEEMPEHPGEWQIVADVHIVDGVEFSAGGFSFSKVEVVKRQAGALGALFVPYPLYRDNAVMSEVLSYNPRLNAGRWIKKSVDPVTIALIGLAAQATYFVLTPAWKKTFDEIVWPFLQQTLGRYREGRLKDNPLDYGFMVRGQNGEPIQVYFAGQRRPVTETLSKRLIEDGLARAIEFAATDQRARTQKLAMIKLCYCGSDHGFKICDVRYEDGSVVAFTV